MKRYLHLLILLLLVACTANQTQDNSTDTPEPVTNQPAKPTDSLPVATHITIESPSSTTTSAPSVPTSISSIIATETPSSNNSIEIPFTTGFLIFFWDTETPLEEPSAWSIPAGEPKQDLYVAIPGSNANTWQVQSLLRQQLDWPDQAPNWPAASISSDKTKIAFQVQRFSDFGQSAYSNSIYMYDWVEGTIREIVPETTLEIFSLGWMPDSHTLTYVQGNELYKVDIMTTAPPQPLTNPFIGQYLRQK